MKQIYISYYVDVIKTLMGCFFTYYIVGLIINVYFYILY